MRSYQFRRSAILMIVPNTAYAVGLPAWGRYITVDHCLHAVVMRNHARNLILRGMPSQSSDKLLNFRARKANTPKELCLCGSNGMIGIQQVCSNLNGLYSKQVGIREPRSVLLGHRLKHGHWHPPTNPDPKSEQVQASLGTQL